MTAEAWSAQRDASPAGSVTLPSAVAGRHRARNSWTLGEVLGAAIVEDGRPVAVIAILLGTARANVVQWCNDQLDPWPENFDALTEYLGIDLDGLGILMIRSQIRRAATSGHGALLHPAGRRIAN